MSKRKSPKKGKVEGAAAAPVLSDSPMNVHLLEQIVKLMSVNDLNTVEVRDGQRRVVLKRGAVVAQAGPGFVMAPPAPAAAPTASAPSAPSAPADETAGMLTIKSPMVGTFYTSSSPDAKAFVSVGTTVDEETDVCIIEAMKVFNNIKAECKGTISKILVTNGQTVEFGQALFLVKP